jgi:hypothetical protein
MSRLVVSWPGPQTKYCGAFHTKDGLFFQPWNDASTGVFSGVRVVKTCDGKEPNMGNVISDTILPKEAWASVVASVSWKSEDGDRYDRAYAFHTEGNSNIPSWDHGHGPQGSRAWPSRITGMALKDHGHGPQG